MKSTNALRKFYCTVNKLFHKGIFLQLTGSNPGGLDPPFILTVAI